LYNNTFNLNNNFSIFYIYIISIIYTKHNFRIKCTQITINMCLHIVQVFNIKLFYNIWIFNITHPHRGHLTIQAIQFTKIMHIVINQLCPIRTIHRNILVPYNVYLHNIRVLFPLRLQITQTISWRFAASFTFQVTVSFHKRVSYIAIYSQHPRTDLI
jgi:hypothetical protein